MTGKDPIKKIQSELQEGTGLEKCRKCGCMQEALEKLLSVLPALSATGSSELLKKVEAWHRQMETTEYSCLGCKHCFPAEVSNIFSQAFPDKDFDSASCAFEVKQETWPTVPGEYFSWSEASNRSIAVATLASLDLAQKLANLKPENLGIVGKTETENIGIEKVVNNIITNPAIRVLLLTGKDPEGHQSGKTLLALRQNGVEENMRVIDSPGKRPVLINLSVAGTEIFRNQVEVVDMIGCEDVDAISQKIKKLASRVSPKCSCRTCDEIVTASRVSSVPSIPAIEPGKAAMDKAGYFVIIPQPEKNIITVEHYSYDNKLKRVIEGRDAKGIYFTIIENGWISQMSHAAYLGKELAKAELSVQLGFKYVQDGA